MSCTIWRIRATKTRPLSVGSTPFAVRTNSWPPTSRSTDWMLRDSADWLSPSDRRRAGKAAVLGEGEHVTHLTDFERHASYPNAAM